MTTLLESLHQFLIEAKIEDVLVKYPHIDSSIRQAYATSIPNSRHLDWTLKHHNDILPHHDIAELLKSFERNKSKLPKKQIEQYKSIDELHQTVLPYIGQGLSSKEKGDRDTTTLYSSSTMTIKQHHSPESCIRAAILPENNRSGKDKAAWCISADSDSQQGYIDKYTHQGLHPIYSIEHHHSDGTSSRHMMVADTVSNPNDVELRNESNSHPTGSLESYLQKYPELHNTPIANRFTEEGRNKINHSIIDSPDTKSIHISNIAKHTTDSTLIDKMMNHPNLDNIGLKHITIKAIKSNNHDLINRAMNHPKLDGGIMHHIVSHAVMNNDNELVDQLINHPKLDDVGVWGIGQHAIETNNHNLIRKVMKHPNIDSDTVALVAKHAIETNNHSLINEIINHPKLDDVGLWGIGNHAIETNNHELMDRVLTHKHSDLDILQKIAGYATKTNNQQLINTILTRR